MTNQYNYLHDAESFYRDAFSRNLGILTAKEQQRLRSAKVAIAGTGSVGGFHLINLVRLGVGGFHIADMDNFEVPNIQRQCGAFMDTLGKNKAETMANVALSINPHLKIKSFSEGVTAGNVDDFFNGVDIFIDGIDFFSIDERRMIFKKAKEKGLYAVTAGPVGFGCAMLIFSPQGMSFDEYFDLNDSMTYASKIIAFGVGLAPAALHLKYLDLGSVDLKEKKGPSLVSASVLCSGIATTEVISILLKRREPRAAPAYSQFDPYARGLKQGYLLMGNRNPVQRLKRWYLSKKFRADA